MFVTWFSARYHRDDAVQMRGIAKKR